MRQGEAVVRVLRALVEHFADRPHLITETVAHGQPDVVAGSEQAVRAAVTYVAGMTDRFAFRQAVALLGWDPEQAARPASGRSRSQCELHAPPQSSVSTRRVTKLSGSM